MSHELITSNFNDKLNKIHLDLLHFCFVMIDSCDILCAIFLLFVKTLQQPYNLGRCLNFKMCHVLQKFGDDKLYLNYIDLC